MLLLLWRVLVWICCLAGCLWQLYHISDHYFAYDTVTEVGLIRHKRYFPPVVTYCFHRTGIFSTSEQQTPKDFFDATPTAHEFVTKFEIHAPNNYVVDEFTNPEHYEKFFLVQKSIKQSYLCYTVKPLKNVWFHYFHLTNSYETPKFYVLTSNSSAFKNSKSIYIFMNSQGDHFHGKSESFTLHSRKLTNLTSGEGDANYLTMSYFEYTLYRLPSPYRTHCINYTKVYSKSVHSQKHCFNECLLNRSLTKLGKVPFAIMVDEPLDIPLVNFDTDVRNETLMKILNKFEAECTKICWKLNCMKRMFSAKVVNSERSAEPTFELLMSSSPAIVTTAVPRITTVEYITYVLSAVSFWISFSPLMVFQSEFVTKFFQGSKAKQNVFMVKTKKIQIREIRNEMFAFREELRILYDIQLSIARKLQI